MIIKPDCGVGASNTYKIDSLENLYQCLNTIDFFEHQYIMEEFVPGHIETFDGIAGSGGQILFCSSQVMKITPLDMLSGCGENVSYTNNLQNSDLMTVGEKTVKAFDVRQGFFHFEFFRLDADKQGLGKKDDIVGLEVNMRAPGGYIPDKMNFAYNVDVYQIWAESLVYGQNKSFTDYKFCRYVTHYGRGASVNYKHSAEDICGKFSNRLLIEKTPPKSISGGMGTQVFILESQSVAQLEEDGAYILEK